MGCSRSIGTCFRRKQARLNLGAASHFWRQVPPLEAQVLRFFNLTLCSGDSNSLDPVGAETNVLRPEERRNSVAAP